MTPRQTDTRERIQQIALELFAEKGYEGTSLREIADQLGITKAALYYHFKAKEDILRSVVAELNAELDALIEWGTSQPATLQVRTELLRRLSELVSGIWQEVMRFAQRNQGELQSLQAGQEMQQRMAGIMEILIGKDTDPAHSLRVSLAVVGLFLVQAAEEAPGMPKSRQERSAVALAVATDLISRD